MNKPKFTKAERKVFSKLAKRGAAKRKAKMTKAQRSQFYRDLVNKRWKKR